MRPIYSHSCPLFVYEVICICGIYVTFEEIFVSAYIW